MTYTPHYLLLDASCLLNLYATGFLREIAATLNYQFAVVDYVLDQEALYIWIPKSDASSHERAPVDLSPLVSEALIHVMRLENIEEEITFVDLAALVDDGEAMTVAVAFHRNCSVATDDRKARRVIEEQFPAIPLVSTLELFSLWSQDESVSIDQLQASMTRMRTKASFVPRNRDPLFEWWREVIRGTT